MVHFWQTHSNNGILFYYINCTAYSQNASFIGVLFKKVGIPQVVLVSTRA